MKAKPRTATALLKQATPWRIELGAYLLSFDVLIKVHKATRWTIRHGLMLLWLKDLMNVAENTIH